jgi:hypothetical protein
VLALLLLFVMPAGDYVLLPSSCSAAAALQPRRLPLFCRRAKTAALRVLFRPGLFLVEGVVVTNSAA